ncbi:MAG: hypothetical protein CSA32_03860 [Desulfobulbus propionicus]|nr:MAG: hypothetical protein CSA32_03860 [Desulfobulbus propionicus]
MASHLLGLSAKNVTTHRSPLFERSRPAA